MLVEGYGLSQTSPIVAVQPVAEGGKERREREATIGLPVTGTRIEIISLEDHETVRGYGEENRGEVCISGPQVMKGCWRNPEETPLLLTAKSASARVTSVSWMKRVRLISSIVRKI